MRLSNESSRLKKVKLPNTWDTIHRIEQTLGLFDQDLSDKLQLTHKELAKIRETKKEVSADKIFSLAERLDISFNSIVNGKIDYQALAQHYFGNKSFVPERYASGDAFSRRRSTLFILNYIEKNFGWKERLYVLRNFQLNESIFSNPDLPISFLFASDLCEYLRRYKLDRTSMIQIGVQSYRTVAGPLKAELANCTNVSEIYERMCGELIQKHFEKNFQYRVLKMNDGNCTISVRPNQMLTDLLETRSVSNPGTELTRLGITVALPTILGLPVAEVKQTASIHDGAKEIRYEIDFTEANVMLKKIRMNQYLERSFTAH